MPAAVSSSLSLLERLSLFAPLRDTPLLRTFEDVLRHCGAPSLPAAWSCFTAAFAADIAAAPACRRAFYAALYRLTRLAENPWTGAAECGRQNEDGFLNLLAVHDIQALRRIASFDFNIIAGHCNDAQIKAECALINPGAEDEAARLFSADTLAADIRRGGAGLFAEHTMFLWENGLRPARRPDTVCFAALTGYEAERNVVIENTRRFLAGAAANNMLLYGDRGTGKSATVKAVCNEFSGSGLRLIELRKEDFTQIRALCAKLDGRGLKFILFIDDLSFEQQDDSFTMLKALLEGGVESRPDNVIIYATSNRRHFVKEKFAERPADSDDVRAFDTMQERLSLSDRFGLTVIFTAPAQDEYLRIAESIACRRGALVTADTEARALFRENALKWERWFNGRSPRTACQFVDWFASGKGYPWD